MRRHFGQRIRILYWYTDRRMTDALSRMELTASQSWILRYVDEQKTAPCPRDIEEAFGFSHATVSGLIARLEQKGFLQLRPDATDRRCKRVYLLPKGVQIREVMCQTIRETERRLLDGFTEEEQAQFSALLDRAIQNMGGVPEGSVPSLQV